jgi:hypothetical protein
VATAADSREDSLSSQTIAFAGPSRSARTVPFQLAVTASTSVKANAWKECISCYNVATESTAPSNLARALNVPEAASGDRLTFRLQSAPQLLVCA